MKCVPLLKCDFDEEFDRDNAPSNLGDYRQLYETKVDQMEQRRKNISAKLKNIKQKQSLTKEKSKAKRIDAVDLRKNRRRAPAVKRFAPFKEEKKSKGGISSQAFYESLGLTNKSKMISKVRR
eukprot:g2531.t2